MPASYMRFTTLAVLTTEVGKQVREQSGIRVPICYVQTTGPVPMLQVFRFCLDLFVMMKSREAINHAIRFTAPRTRNSHIYPARHHAGESNDPSLPPMGLRVRLKASVNISVFSAKNRIILTALKRYGMILADNGSPWFITGVSDRRWNAEDLDQLKRIKGNSFEAVDTSSLRNGN